MMTPLWNYIYISLSRFLSQIIVANLCRRIQSKRDILVTCEQTAFFMDVKESVPKLATGSKQQTKRFLQNKTGFQNSLLKYFI